MNDPGDMNDVAKHRDRHVMLHRCLDELLADYMAHHPGELLSSTTLMQLIKWSAEQTDNPTPDPRSAPMSEVESD